MRLAVFSAKPHDRCFLDAANTRAAHTLRHLEARLDRQTAELARGHDAVSLFVNDHADALNLQTLAEVGVRLITLRSAGYNQIDLEAARRLGLTVTHAPAYSPHSVAEHTIALLLSLVRRIPHAYCRVREGNFSLDGLLGFDLHGKTVALVGAGQIGLVTGRILLGFGCRVLAYDPRPSAEAHAAGIEFTPLAAALGAADIVTLHCPLLAGTRHLINRSTLGWMKRGAILLNTSRGGLVDYAAALEALENGRIGALGLDLYEDEASRFFEQACAATARDKPLAHLLALPNVMITGHQGFFTREALAAIAASTLAALDAFAAGLPCPHTLTSPAASSGRPPPPAPHGSMPVFPLESLKPEPAPTLNSLVNGDPT
jgi:D-lactate dehydrogenase